MATKKNISSTEVSNSYIPPRLVKARQGWYVVYYHKLAGEWQRFRKTFNLNRIVDRRRRLERAREIMKQIDESLIHDDTEGIAESEFAILGKTPLLDALDLAAKIVCQSSKKDTRKSYKMIHGMLADFIRRKHWQSLTITDFGSKHARAFLDNAIQRGISNTTFNNYRGFAGTLFNKLVNREYIARNPFEKISMLEREEKKRRAFTDEEKEIVLAEIYAKDYWLFILVLLHRLTLLRRTECYRLRFNNFNLVESYVYLPKSATKNGRVGVVTIPHDFRKILIDPRFSSNPANYLLFGPNGQPHPSLSAGENTYKERHRAILLRLKEAGKLADITGLSMYSWKDTGMTEFAKVLRPIELRDQARHSSIDQSLVYYHADKVIERVKHTKFDLAMDKK